MLRFILWLLYSVLLLVNIVDLVCFSILLFFQNGVRGLMLDMYDFENDIWLCHSFRGQCFNFTAFVINLLLPFSIFFFFPSLALTMLFGLFGSVSKIVTIDIWVFSATSN